MMEIAPPDEANCWSKAREVVDQYGDEVGTFLEMVIDVCIKEGKWQLFLEWTTIRNCVAIILDSGGTAGIQ
jgi:hypothetical protein